MEFWSLTFGNALTIIILGAGGLGFVYTIRGRVDALSERLLVLEGELRRLVDVLIAQGRQAERITAIEDRLSGQGRRLDELIQRFNNKMDVVK